MFETPLLLAAPDAATTKVGLHYQPLVSLRDGRVAGVEALLRADGFDTPHGILAAASTAGRALELGSWVLDRACSDFARWRPLHGGSLQVSVNLGAEQLHPGLADTVADVLTAHGMRPHELALEVTESLAATAVAPLADVRKLGVEIVLDDFGTGGASLLDLADLSPQVLKIDPSVVAGIDRPGPGEAVVAAVIALGHALGCRVLAEGVERREQLGVLSDLGCELAQGSLLSGAAAPEDIARLLALAGA